MMNPAFSFEGFADEFEGKPTYLFDVGGGVGVDDLWSGYGGYQENPLEKGGSFQSPTGQPCFPEFMAIDEVQFDAVSAAIQLLERPTAADDLFEQSLLPQVSKLLRPPKKKAFSSLELLNNYKPSYNRLAGEKINVSSDKESNPIEGGGELSTEQVMRVAAVHFIQLSARGEGDPSMLRLSFGLSLSNLTVNEIKNIDLANLLLTAAEKVSNQQYGRASNLLRQCYKLSSNTGNPVQRVVYYFSDALQERIDRETGRKSSKRPKERGGMTAQDVMEAVLANHPMQLITHKALPFPQLCQFTSIQALIDHTASAKRIHMIDLSIKHGLQWTVLMQALATRPTCPIEYLKISAVGSSAEAITITGKRLSSFAETLSLPFVFRAVIAPEMKDLREDMFELEEGEAVGVYSDMDMNCMIVKPESLENLMRVIRRLKPCVMTVIDVEAKLNSASFINRFAEALFYFSTFFDCVDNFFERCDCNRMVLEGIFFWHGIQNIVATEDSERVMRHVGISVWREFFARFGLVEAELNEWSIYQASLLAKQFVNGSSCSLDKNGKSLLIGWKDTPLYFASAWKFQ